MRIAKYLDMDNDESVSFPEFYQNMKIYLTMFLKLTDTDRDGSIYDDVQNGKAEKAGITVFETFLNQAFKFFDIDENEVLSISDLIELDLIDETFDANGDSQITLDELSYYLVGSPMNKLPSPYYDLYKKVDKNEDEKLSHEEANDFLKRLLTALNKKPDCNIEPEEVVQLFNLPSKCTTAIQKHVNNEIKKQTKEIKAVVKKLDKATNNDQKLTYTEIIELQMDTMLTFMNSYNRLKPQQNGEVGFLAGLAEFVGVAEMISGFETAPTGLAKVAGVPGLASLAAIAGAGTWLSEEVEESCRDTPPDFGMFLEVNPGEYSSPLYFQAVVSML